MKKSKLFSLNSMDFINGLFMAILTPAVVIIGQSVELGVLTFNWHQILLASIGGLVAYFLKNLSRNEKGQFFKEDKDGAVIPSKGFKVKTNGEK